MIITDLDEEIWDFFSEMKDPLITIQEEQKKIIPRDFIIRHVLGGLAARR